MSLLKQIGEVLRAGVEPAAVARGAYLKGQQQKKDRDRAFGLQEKALERQSRIDKLEADYKESQIDENKKRGDYYERQGRDTSDQDARRANAARDRAATGAIQREDLAAKRRAYAEKYIEATGGDVQRAILNASSDPEGSKLFGGGMDAAEFQSAAQRHKDRFKAKAAEKPPEKTLQEQLDEVKNGPQGGGAAPSQRAPVDTAHLKRKYPWLF